MSPVSEDRQRGLLTAAAIVVGVSLLIWGLSRLIPVEAAAHATADVEQQLHCVNGGDSGESCDIRVGFYDGSRYVRAVVLGANPGEITVSNGQRVLEIYFQPQDPYHPRELADDVINDTLLIGVAVVIVVVALVLWFKRRAQQVRDERRSPFPRKPRASLSNRSSESKEDCANQP